MIRLNFILKNKKKNWKIKNRGFETSFPEIKVEFSLSCHKKLGINFFAKTDVLWIYFNVADIINVWFALHAAIFPYEKSTEKYHYFWQKNMKFRMWLV